MANNVDMGQINWTVKATAEEASDQVKNLSTNINGLSNQTISFIIPNTVTLTGTGAFNNSSLNF